MAVGAGAEAGRQETKKICSWFAGSSSHPKLPLGFPLLGDGSGGARARGRELWFSSGDSGGGFGGRPVSRLSHFWSTTAFNPRHSPTPAWEARVWPPFSPKFPQFLLQHAPPPTLWGATGYCNQVEMLNL